MIEIMSEFELMRERRVLTSMPLLKKAMEQDTELMNFLMTPIISLPSRYVYLIASSPSEVDFRARLYDAIYYCLKEYTQAEFSMVGNKLTGFMAYLVNPIAPASVKDVAFVSFDTRVNNFVLLRDMQSLLKDLQKKYGTIQWRAAKNNPANRIYRTLVKKEDGIFGVDARNPNFIIYEIPGTCSVLKH